MVLHQKMTHNGTICWPKEDETRLFASRFEPGLTFKHPNDGFTPYHLSPANSEEEEEYHKTYSPQECFMLEDGSYVFEKPPKFVFVNKK